MPPSGTGAGGKPAIHARRHDISASASGGASSGIRAPHVGGSSVSFSMRYEASGSPGTINVLFPQPLAPAPINRSLTPGDWRSRNSAGPTLSWQVDDAQRGTKICCSIDSIVGSHAAVWVGPTTPGLQAPTPAHTSSDARIAAREATLIRASNAVGRLASDRRRYGVGQALCFVQKCMPPALQQTQPAFAHGVVSQET